MQLRSTRLVFREVRPEDWVPVLAYRSDPALLRFSPEYEYTEESARAFIERFLRWQAEDPRTKYPWAVSIAGSGELIGICSLRMESPSAHYAEIGFELASAHWGRGYATEMGEEMLRLGFRSLGLHRIEAHCIAENAASARVLQKLGMQQEGRLRDRQWLKGRYWDELRFAMLRPEWTARRHTGG